jgi:hypothetical protein
MVSNERILSSARPVAGNASSNRQAASEILVRVVIVSNSASNGLRAEHIADQTA